MARTGQNREIGGAEKKASTEASVLAEVDRAIPPFSYPPFTAKSVKKAVALACVITVIVGLVILSLIVQALPDFKVFSEALAKDTLTAEEEALADSATLNLLIFYAIGIVVLAAITVGVAFAVKKIKLKRDTAEYEREKRLAYEEWENKKIELVELELRKRAYKECPFCGKKLTHVYDKGKDNSYYDTVYDVTGIGGSSATITPRSVKHEVIDLTGAFERYSCTYCYFSIENRPLVNYTTQGYLTTIDIWKGSKIKYAEVEKTLLYNLMKERYKSNL